MEQTSPLYALNSYPLQDSPVIYPHSTRDTFYPLRDLATGPARTLEPPTSPLSPSSWPSEWFFETAPLHSAETLETSSLDKSMMQNYHLSSAASSNMTYFDDHHMTMPGYFPHHVPSEGIPRSCALFPSTIWSHFQDDLSRHGPSIATPPAPAVTSDSSLSIESLSHAYPLADSRAGHFIVEEHEVENTSLSTQSSSAYTPSNEGFEIIYAYPPSPLSTPHLTTPTNLPQSTKRSSSRTSGSLADRSTSSRTSRSNPYPTPQATPRASSSVLSSPSPSPPAMLHTYTRRNEQVTTHIPNLKELFPKMQMDGPVACPLCDKFVQQNGNIRSLQRHVDSHGKQKHPCCGIPVERAVALGLYADIASATEAAQFYDGELRVGGCNEVCCRRDALLRHAKKKGCLVDAVPRRRSRESSPSESS